MQEKQGQIHKRVTFSYGQISVGRSAKLTYTISMWTLDAADVPRTMVDRDGWRERKRERERERERRKFVLSA